MVWGLMLPTHSAPLTIAVREFPFLLHVSPPQVALSKGSSLSLSDYQDWVCHPFGPYNQQSFFLFILVCKPLFSWLKKSTSFKPDIVTTNELQWTDINGSVILGAQGMANNAYVPVEDIALVLQGVISRYFMSWFPWSKSLSGRGT